MSEQAQFAGERRQAKGDSSQPLCQPPGTITTFAITSSWRYSFHSRPKAQRFGDELGHSSDGSFPEAEIADRDPPIGRSKLLNLGIRSAPGLRTSPRRGINARK